MPGSTVSLMIPPPNRGSNLSGGDRKYLQTLQRRLPLETVDTSAGSYAETAPPAGLNSASGETNQNQEITYVKTSADANTFTLNGVEGGPYTLTAQLSFLRIKSNGTSWYVSAQSQAAPTPPPVTSVFGRIGAVVAAPGDYSVAQVTGAAPLASPALTGVPTAPTPAPGDNSTKIATTAFVAAAAGGPVISDANSVLFWGPGITPSQLAMDGSVINGTPITSANNLVYVFQFVLPVAMTIRQLVWYLNSGVPGEVFSFGIYNSAKNLLLQVSNTRTTGQNIYASAFAGVTLQPGVYWFAQTCSGTTCNGMNATSTSFGGGTFAPFALRNNGYAGPVQMSGVAANAAVGGVLPASLGVISNATANVGASPALPMWAA